MGGPSIKPTDNAATPLAKDFVSQLQGYLDANALGTGSGPLQQGAGKAITNFVNTGVNRIATGGLDPGTKALIDALSANSAVSTGRQAGDLREAFGAAGTRFGGTLAMGEGLLRGEAQRGLQTDIGSILVQQQQSNDANLLAAIAEMSRQGGGNLQPFLAALGLGVPQAENVVSPGIGQQILSGLLSAGGQAAGAFAGRGGGK
jgi:hypothetical protein